MDATVSVELGSDDAYLEVPWEAGDVRYYDLKRHPELLVELPEAQRNRELGEFLSAINSELSMLESAKCDAWLSDQMAEEEKVYAACCKFGSYVDLVFSDTKSRMALSAHENFGKRIARLLRRAPDLPSSAEFIIRRCYFQPGAGGDAPQDGGSAEGFYFTFYLYGYGNDQDEARRRWGIALKVVENALLQLSAMHRRGSNQTEPPPPETLRALGNSG